MKYYSPEQCGLVGWASFYWFDSWSEDMPGSWIPSQVGHIQDQCFSPSLSPSFLLSWGGGKGGERRGEKGEEGEEGEERRGFVKKLSSRFHILG